MAAPAAVLNVIVTANTAPVNAALATTQTNLRRTSSVANTVTAAIGTKMARAAKIGAAAVGTGLAYGLYKGAKAGVDFEKSMDALGAVTGATAKEMERLQSQALKMGQKTVFSANEVAAAQSELAKGGLQLKDIMGGALPAALNLAAAGELDLATAAETTVTAMKQFGLSGRDSGKVADMLATAANTTTADVEDFAMALKMGGSAAKVAGLDMNDTVTVLEALAEIGIKNSDAGTAMKAAFLQLLAPTDKQAKLSKKLGLEFINQNGEMKSAVGISAELRDATTGMTDAQRAQTLKVLAGTDGFRTLVALYDKGPKKLRELAAANEEQGTAQEIANKRMDNTAGSIEQLLGALETLAVKGWLKIAPAVRSAVDAITKGLNDIDEALSSAEAEPILKGIGTAFKVMGRIAETWFDIIKGSIERSITVVKTLLAPFRFIFNKVGGTVAEAADTVLGVLTTMIDGIAKGADVLSHLPGPAGDFWDDVQSGAEGAAGDINEFREELRKTGEQGRGKWRKDMRALVEDTHKGGKAVAEAGQYWLRRFSDTADKEGKRGRDAADKRSGQMGAAVWGNARGMVKNVTTAYALLEKNTNNSLSALDQNRVDFKLGNSLKSGNTKQKFYQRGGHINLGEPSGDSVPALLERGEYVLNRNAVSAMGKGNLDRINFGAASRFQAGGVAGLQPGISRLVNWAAQRYGLRVSSGLRPGDSGSYHSKGWAADLIPPSMSATRGIFGAFRNQLAELFYDPWGGYNDGQMIGPIGGHMDHIHAAIIGAGSGGPSGIAKLKRLFLQGPPGAMRSMGQAGIDRVGTAAKRYLGRHAMTAHGNIGVGNISGPLQAIARRMVGQRWGAGQWSYFNDLVMRESGWDPTAVNPSSGAAGLAQALPPSKYPPGAWPYAGKSSAVKQLQWMMQYISGRYGNPAGAIAWHNAHNWYQQGGEVLPSLDTGGHVSRGGIAEVHPGDVHRGDGGPMRLIRGELTISPDGIAFIEGVAIDVVDENGRQQDDRNRRLDARTVS